MLANPSSLKNAGLFYLLVMTLSLALVLFFRITAPQTDLVIPINMLTPFLATVIMLVVVTREGYARDGRATLGLGRSGVRSWGLALLLPLPVLLASYGLGWWSGIAALVPPAEEDWLPKLLIRLPVRLPMAVLLALGEEIGFRGYLFPHLLELGPKRAAILSGFLHGTWHLPLILLTPFYLTEGNPLITIPIFLLLFTAAGAIYGWLRLGTNSIWPPSILHGAFNAFLDIFTRLTLFTSPLAVYFVGESGVLTFLATAAVAFWFLRRRSMDPAAADYPMAAA
ncbi:MAG TPA: CPBP family intramembrane glutamic endopeptidase [Anaerolineales bacterium]|nr:CPBP family intramembrane glutamic endopeptidase [Anaerolineales bacterium]